MRFRHEKARKMTAKRTVSFLLMLCLLLPMIPSSMGLEAKADDDTTTSSDTVTIKLHDLYIDRKEALPDGTDLVKLETKAQGKEVTQDKACLHAYEYARSITVPKGTTLEQAFQNNADDSNLQLGTSSLAATKVYKPGTEDKTAMTSEINASKCVWYTRGVDKESHSGGIDGNNPREKFNFNTEITEDIDLYTYSYRLRLVTGKQEYKDLIVREGQTRGFIAGNRDEVQDISAFLNANSVDNKWTDVNLGTTLTNTTQFDNGITQNYTLRQSENSQNTTTLTYYAAVDGEWKAVKTDSAFDLDRVDVWGRIGPALNYYVTDDELAAVYGTQYGFKKTDFKGKEITKQKNGYFPYSNGTNDTLHIRQMPKYETVNEETEETQFRVPLIEDTPATEIAEGGLAIYYTPHNTTDYPSSCFLEGSKNGNGSVKKDNAAVLKENSFYTVSVDTDKTFAEGKTLPNKDEYHLYGSDVTFTLPLKDTSGNTVKWYVEKGGDNVTIDEKTGKVTVTAIDKQLILTTDASKEYADDVQVHCFVLVNGKSQEIGKLHTSATQFNDSWGSGDNKTRYYVTAKQVETVFKKFGFEASTFDPTQDAQKYIFANTTYSNNTSTDENTTIWMDAVPKKFGSDVYIPLAKSKEFDGKKGSKDLSLYYVPNNTTVTKSVKVNTNTDFKKNNTFYSVDALDEANTLGTSFTKPETQYFLTGTDATVTLPNATWYGRDEKDNGVLVTNGKVQDNNISITIPDISCATILTTKQPDPNSVIFQALAVVDEKWKVIQKEKFDKAKNLTKDGHYYVSIDTLEDIYGGLGFTAKDATADSLKKQFFSTTTSGGTTTIQSNDTVTIDGKLCVKTTVKQDDSTKGISLYYVPENTEDSCSITDKTVISQNNFYSIEVNNENKQLSDDEIPSKQYFRAGTDAKFTLPTKSGVEWYIKEATLDKEDYFVLNQGKTSSVFSVSNIKTSVVLTAIKKGTSSSSTKSDRIVSLHCYVSVDKAEVEAGTLYFSTKQTEKHIDTSNSKYGWGSASRYFVSPQMLERVYKNYGFNADSYKGERYFPSTIHEASGNNTPSKLWADAMAVSDSSSYQIPLLTTEGGDDEQNAKKNIDTFYLPNNKEGNNFYFTSSKERTTIVSNGANTFYSITAKDEANKFPGVTLPDIQYALTGTDKTITLPYDENVNWYIDSDGATTKIEPNAGSMKDREAAYTLKNVTKSIKLTTDGLADNEVAVAGYISMNGKWTKVSSTLQKISIDQNDGTRYYLTSAQLESLFGSYGFKASDYANTSEADLSKYFPSSTIQIPDGYGAEANYAKIWTDAKGKKNTDGTWQVNTIQLKNRDKGIAVYYVPNIAHVTENSFAKTNTNVLEDNQFYTISFEDSTGKLSNVPSTMYRRAGQVKVTLPYAEGITWTAMGKVDIAGSEVSSAATTIQEVNADKTEVQLTITVNASLTVTTDTSVDKNQINLVSYVAIDGEWKQVDTSLTTLSKLNWDSTIDNDSRGKGRFYITAEELETIYGQYGFQSSDCTVDNADTRLFAVRTKYQQNLDKNTQKPLVSDDKIWADQLPKASGSSWYLPLIESGYVQKEQLKDNVVYLYYLPKNKSSEKEYFKDYCANTKQEMINANSFYTIQVKDTGNNFDSSELPKDQLLLSGQSKKIPLPYKDGVTWKVTDTSGALIHTEQTIDESNKTVTISISSINQPLVITTGQATNVTLAANEIAVNAYIAIDDAWVPVGTEWKYTDGRFVGDEQSFTAKDTQTTKIDTGKKDSNGNEIIQTRYYLTPTELEHIFGTYGFKAADYTGKDGKAPSNIFPHGTIRNFNGDIYANIDPVKIDEAWCVPVINTDQKDNGISIYYTPTRTDGRSFWGDKNTNLLQANSVYYTISAKDRLGVLPKDTSLDYPATVQVERNESKTYKLPELPKGYHWAAVNKKNGKPLTKTKVEQSSTNPLEYTVSNILEPVQFIVWKDGEKRLIYDAQITPEKLTTSSSFAQPEKQVIVTDGSIGGAGTKSISCGSNFDGNTTILSTDSERAEVSLTESGHPRTFYYTFQGWQVDGTKTILKPGASLSEFKDYQNYELISLTAVWKAVDENSRPKTVNFYVNLTCEILDNTGTVKPQDKDNFTESVYATRIYGTDKMSGAALWEDPGSSMFSITAGETSENAYAIDSTLRQMSTVPINTKPEQGKDGKAVPLKLESFPTDEEVLENLRDEAGWNKDKQIKLDGKVIDKEDLTTDNFAVRWYVLKYQSADAWHIDGVLVAKEAHAVVTKTFAGNAEAIKAVKENYSISVTHGHAQTAIDEIEGLSETDETETAAQEIDTDYTLVLKSKEEVEKKTDSEQRGYDSYDEATDTYTWILTGRQGREYRVKENNYLAPTTEDSSNNLLYNGTYRYMIKNCTLKGVTNDVWQAYEGNIAQTGIDLVAEAYPTDVSSSAYQTISFENRYVSAGDLTIQKIDSVTQNGLKNVNFTLSRLNADDSENTEFTLWKNGNTSEYVVLTDDTMADSLEKHGYTQVNRKIVMTNQNGYMYLRLPPGDGVKYQLKETVPLGYKGASTITITVDANGKMSKVTTDPADDNKWFDLDENGAILTIKNESRLLTTVTALKQWNKNTKKADQEPVKVELWRNGAKMNGSTYTQELNESNNWQYEWPNLPLFIDGAIAKYELREVAIGNTVYDAGADEDGYADYNVSYDSAKYYEGDARPELSENAVDKSQFTSTTATWKDGTSDETHYANHALLVVNNSLAKGYISFQKMDGLNRPLAGAEFTLYSDESCSTAVAVAKATSQSDGTVQFDSQRAGTYYMKETKAPTGYAIDSTVYTVTVSDIGNVKITKPSDNRDDDNSTDTVMRITNVSDRTLTLRKVSSTSGAQPLKGAEFTITRDNTNLGTFTTDEKGETNFNGLRLEDGEYRITETKAPDGYTALGDHIDIIVKNGTVELGRHNEAAWELKYFNNSYTLTVKNAPESNGVLPSTGGNSYAALVAALGAAIMCGAAALAFWLRKRRSSEENNPNINT